LQGLLGIDLAPYLDVQWTHEALADPLLVEVVPYPRSRLRASGFIGWPSRANRVVVVIGYRDLDGDLHARFQPVPVGGDRTGCDGPGRSKENGPVDPKTDGAARAERTKPGPCPPSS